MDFIASQTAHLHRSSSQAHQHCGLELVCGTTDPLRPPVIFSPGDSVVGEHPHRNVMP
jgi:hypothetical protein